MTSRPLLALAALFVLSACPDGAGDDAGGEGEGEGEGEQVDGNPNGADANEPCASDEDCKSASCIEVCRCDRDDECAGNSAGPFCGPGLLCGPCRDNGDCSPDGNPAGFSCASVIDGLGEMGCFAIGCLDDSGCGNLVCERACDANTLLCVEPAQAGETCARSDEDVCESYTRTCDDGLTCTAVCDDGGECLACE